MPPTPSRQHLRDELDDFRLIEHRLTHALPRLLLGSPDPEFEPQLLTYLAQTRAHIARLEYELGVKPHPAPDSPARLKHPPQSAFLPLPSS